MSALSTRPMSKRKTAKPIPASDRVTLLNVKGSDAEKDFLSELSDETGVSLSEIARRGIAMFAAKRKTKTKPPAHWIED